MTEPTGTAGYAAPSYSGGPGPAEAPARPTSVTLAFFAWLLMTALSLLSLVFVLTSVRAATRAAALPAGTPDSRPRTRVSRPTSPIPAARPSLPPPSGR